MSSDFIFPRDENGDVLRRMQADGDDLSVSRDIEFFFIFSERDDAESFAAAVASPELLAVVSRYEQRNMWQAKVTRYMLPTHADISALESRLSAIAAEFHGNPDGWGCFQQP